MASKIHQKMIANRTGEGGGFAKEQLDKLDSVLDEYESSLGLPKFSYEFHDDTAKKYLQLTRDIGLLPLILPGFNINLKFVNTNDHIVQLANLLQIEN